MSSLLSLNFRNQNKGNKNENNSKIMKKEENEIMESVIMNSETKLMKDLDVKKEELKVEKIELEVENLNLKKEVNINNNKECILISENLKSHQGENMDPVNCKWYGEFESDGSITCIGNNGNIRVLYGDSLFLKLYNGIIEGDNFALKIENFFGESEIIKVSSKDSYGNSYWNLKLEYSGSIKIQIIILDDFSREKKDSNLLNNSLKVNILIIEPKLYIRNNYIPNTGICMQTILSQCLGNIKNWKRRLEIISKLNYNMVHFTPLQKFGQSGSCYSLADQNEISSIFFNEENNIDSNIENESKSELLRYTKEEKYDFLKKVIGELENDFGLLSACDIVLNHTADNSSWLIDHPECGYCLDNSPHLTASVELDQKLQEFSNDVYNGKYLNKYGIDKNINNMKHIDSIMLALKEEIIIPFKIKEYFILNINKIIENIQRNDIKEDWLYDEILDKIKHDNNIEDKLYNVILHFTCTKRGEITCIPNYILNKLNIINKEHDLRNLLEKIQKRLFEFTDEIINKIQSSIRGLIIWERIECKKGPIGLNHWEALTPRYFTPIKDKSGKMHYLANNGWVMGWNAKDDFASSGTFVYLKRDLIVWSDCVKLRYGKSESDAPFLWKWMSDYCKSIASIFHAIRLDNCHSTPLHVAKHMLRECRKVRPNIWIYAELFTGDYQVDLEFERNLGLNALIREAMRAENPGSLGFSVSNYSTAPIGGLLTIPSMYQSVNIEQCIDDIKNNVFPMLPIMNGAKPLKKLSCPAIFFDCTHDNETPSEIRTPIDTLPTAALVASTNCALGSTRGFDELVPHNISVVSERRLYQNYIINVNSDTVPNKDNNETNISIRSRSNSLGPFERLSSNYLSELSTINWNYGETKNNSNISTEVTIEWRHHANSVEIRGNWDNWKESIKLDKHPNGNFVTKLFIKFGKEESIESKSSNSSCKIIHPINNRLQYEYKYIVDGNWVHDSNLPYSIDENGNINNTITLLKRQRSIAVVSKWKYGDQLPGIMSARKILNKLHQQMAIYGFNESHVHYLTQDIIMVQRYNPKIQENIYFITHSSFSYNKIDQLPSSIILDGCIKDTVFAGTLFVPNYTSVYKNDSNRIHGLDSELHKYKNLEEISNVRYNQELNQTILNLTHFPPGSLVILHTIRHKGFSITQNALIEFYKNTQINLPKIISKFLKSDDCHPSDAINYILFSCNNEEMDRSQGQRGVYNVPNLGDFVYSGIYSCIHALDSARRMDDNGKSHPFVVNLKQGPWYINYCIERLRQYKGVGINCHKRNYPKNNDNFNNNCYPLLELADWINEQYNLVNKIANIPIEYIVTYIDIMFSSIYRYLLYYILNNDEDNNLENLNSNTITELFMKHDSLYIHLQLSTYQVYSYVPSSPLIWKTRIPSISAGLPHFSTGFMRSWGRDTFIAFSGILISSKRYVEAKEEILGIARLMKHGLIPNLIDSGNRPRYNARDATWFFVYSIVEYCRNVNNGIDILSEDVELRYPIDIQEISCKKDSFEWLINKSDNQKIKSLKICEIIQFILTKHLVGIKFREENAGIQLDEQMTDLGFNIEINWDPNNGLIYGGNIHNCGTWMDKMGSSIKANNKGIPSSPRDGADIEIIALLYSTLKYISELAENNKFPFQGIKYSSNNFITYSNWSNLIKSNFERCFYIPNKNEINSNYEIDPKLINRTEIYKDTYKSTHLWTDYQLRPNVVVAISVAHDLFDSNHALKTLENVEKYLFTPNMLGIKTLDPSDYNYRPNYDNSNDSDDFKIAHGFNYHQGPEWVWPMGHFLTAKYILLKEKYKNMNKDQAKKLAVYETMKHLINHRKYIVNDKWGSLPELTNENGTFCKDSCYSQAWSIGTILYFLTHTLNN